MIAKEVEREMEGWARFSEALWKLVRAGGSARVAPQRSSTLSQTV